MDKKQPKLQKMRSLTTVKPSLGVATLKSNSSFCGMILKQNKMVSIVDEPKRYEGDRRELVYNLSASGYETDVLAKIIELLLQLRAAQSDQNVFVQNNTVVREQILNQLKNEILRVNSKLTKSQVKSLEVVSSDSFDPEALNEILKSLLESSKKKLDKEEPVTPSNGTLRVLNDYVTEKVNRNYNRVINNAAYTEKLVNRIFETSATEDRFVKNEHINLKHDTLRNVAKKEVSQDGARSEKVLNKNIKIQKEITKPELTQSYEKNILKTIEKVLPVIKNKTKAVNISFLENLTSFVRNVEKSPAILNTFIAGKKINKVKNIFENETVNLPRKENITSENLVNRKNILTQGYEDEVNTVENTDTVKYRYLLNKNIVDKVFQNSILAKEFETKISKYKNILKHTHLKNKYLKAEDKKIQKIFGEELVTHEDLVHKTQNTEEITDTKVVNENVLNDIFKNNFKKEIVNTKKEIKKNINVINEKNIREKFNFITEKSKKNIKTYRKGKKLTYNTEISDLKNEIISTENIVKNIPLIKKEETISREALENIIYKNITKVPSPKTMLKSVYKKENRDVYKNIITDRINEHIGAAKFIQKNILADVHYIDKAQENPVALEKNYMVYKEEFSPLEETQKIIDSKEKAKQEKKPSPKALERKKPIFENKEIDTKKLEKDIMEKTLKKSEVKKMIEEYMSGVNLESISREVIRKVENNFTVSGRRNGMF